MSGERVEIELEAVPETLLWTLYHRALEAKRPDTVLRDPVAVELVERIDYPFEQKFGSGRLSQWQALRAKCFDREVCRFLAANPEARVIALGEGLETQFWRVDDGRVEWLSVDLPEAIAVREQFLPRSERRRTIAASVLERDWLEAIDPGRPTLVTAQGLLMYLQPAEIHGLIRTWAARHRGGSLVFDAVPTWLAQRSCRGDLAQPSGYEAPPWHWSLDRREERHLRELSPQIADLRRLRLPRGRGPVHGLLLPLLGATPGLRRAQLSVLRLQAR